MSQDVLPNGWGAVRLGTVLDVISGYAFPSSKFSETKGMPLIRVRDLKGGRNTEICYDGPFEERYRVKTSDLLVGMDGEFTCHEWCGEDALLNQRVCRLIPKPGLLEARFLKYGIGKYLREIEARTAFTTVKHLSVRQISELLFPLPPLSEQRRIADAIDAAMAEADAASHAAEAQRSDLDVLQSRLYESAFPIAPIALENHDAPNGWAWHALTDVAQLESGHTPSRRHPEWWGGDTPWLALPDIRALDGRAAFATAETINDGGLANSSARLLPAGTVCLSRTASVGFVTVMGRSMATSQDFVNWVCGERLNPWFLVYALMASRSWLRELASGAIHKTIYMPTVKALRICVPSMEEQARIVAHINKCRAELATAQRAVARRKQAVDLLPAAILSAAFQGQL